jgi:Protein of unknown function (DUF1638)
MPDRPAGPLIVACGALTRELRQVLSANHLTNVEVRYLPANLHNTPDKITPAIAEHLAEAAHRTVFVAYADCGTGGHLDALLARHPGVHRLPGAHCYETFAGADTFAALHHAEPGAFYLTDFLAKHFDALVWQGLGLDRHPQLLAVYFGNYTRVVLLAQSGEQAVQHAAQRAADTLGLPLHTVHTGVGQLERAVAGALTPVAVR